MLCFNCTQVPILSSSGPGHSEPASASSIQSNNGEISVDEQEEKNITLGDALSMNREKGTPASVEELQNLAGGADIKVISFKSLYERI